MSIPVYAIKSILSPLTEQEIRDYLDRISEHLGEPLTIVTEDEYCESSFGLVYIASGGAEQYFANCYERMGCKPVYLLTRPAGNSLAAAMESLAYIQQRGGKGEILHGTPKLLADQIRILAQLQRAKTILNGQRIGLIGASSDWLIASNCNYKLCSEKLGVTFVDIPLQTVVKSFRLLEYPENKWTDMLQCSAFDKAEIKSALCVYGALHRICKEQGLSAITVRCFDLLREIRTASCLGLAILNAEGIQGGCEGDVPALLTMMIIKALTNQPSFMCNPARLDSVTGEIVLSHCTLPLNLATKFTLDKHYESCISAAIRGKLPEGACTVCKVSGDLSRIYAKTGTIIRNLEEPDLCRTQICVKLPDVQYFLKEPIQNHHVICMGDHADAMHKFLEQLN